MVRQTLSKICLANRYVLILLTTMIIFGYLFMIHEFGSNSNPDIGSQTNTIVIAKDYINHLHKNQFTNSITLISNKQKYIIPDNNNNNDNDLDNYYLSKSIVNNKYEFDDFSFFWISGDGSPLFINASLYDKNHDIGYKSFVFCPMPKNGCSAWKQILRRIKGEALYLADDYWSLHSMQNNLEQDRIHRFDINGANKILYKSDILHAVFVRDPIERGLSAFLDKCIGSHWSKKYWCKPRTNPDNKLNIKIYSQFDLFVDSVVNRPNDISLDFHWLPQNFVCDLYKFVGRYHIYYSKHINARYQFLFDIGGNKTWNKIGADGWIKKQSQTQQSQRRLLSEIQKKRNPKIMGKNATQQMEELDLSGSFLDKYSYHRINASRKLFQFYRPDILAKFIAFYQNDYILFNMTLPEWICKFLNVTEIIDILERRNGFDDFDKTLKRIEMLSYGQYSIYLKDYDHNAIVNHSGVIWTRKNELEDRKKRNNVFIYMFEEMMDFDDDYNTIIHTIRGIAALSNILTFVDGNILPQCFKYESMNNPWDFTKLEQREQDYITKLIDLYFNGYLNEKNIEFLDGFAFKTDGNGIDAKNTFIRWRDDDKIMYHNIHQNMLWMRDIPRKILYRRYYNRKEKKT